MGARTLRVHSAQADRVASCRSAHWHHIVVMPRSCRSLWLAVSQVCHSSPRSQYKFVSQHSSLLQVVSCRVARAQSRIMAHPASYHSLYRCPYCDTNAPPKPRYNLCIATLSASQATRARALGHIAGTARRIVAHSRPCRGRALAVSWPIPCAPMPTVSRYNLLYHNQAWELGSSLSQFLQIFFFTHFFFFSFQLLENHQRRIYIYIYISFSSITK